MHQRRSLALAWTLKAFATADLLTVWWAVGKEEEEKPPVYILHIFPPKWTDAQTHKHTHLHNTTCRVTSLSRWINKSWRTLLDQSVALPPQPVSVWIKGGVARRQWMRLSVGRKSCEWNKKSTLDCVARVLPMLRKRSCLHPNVRVWDFLFGLIVG